MDAVISALRAAASDLPPRAVGTIWPTMYSTKEGKPFNCGWQEFAATLRAYAPTVKPKAWTPAFSPTLNLPSDEGTGSRKKNEAVISTHMLIIDIDGADYKPLLDVIDAAGIARLAYQSPGHMLPEKPIPKGRVGIPFNVPFPTADRDWPKYYRSAVTALTKAAGIDPKFVDLSVDDKSCGFYVASRPSADIAPREVSATDGKTLDLELFTAKLLEIDGMVVWAEETAAKHVEETWDETIPWALRDAFEVAGKLGAQRTDSNGRTVCNVDCPWDDDHTTTSETGTVIYAPTTDSEKGVLKCLHSHCKDDPERKSYEDCLKRLVETAEDIETKRTIDAVEAQREERIKQREEQVARGKQEFLDLLKKVNGMATAERREERAAKLPLTAAQVLMSDSFSAPQRSYTTRFKQLDAMTGGPTEGLLWTIVAPPGTGKTGFAIDLAIDLCPQLPVMMVCTEINREEQAARIAAHKMGITPSRITALKVDPKKAAEAVKDYPIYIYELDCEDDDGIDTIREQAELVREATGTAPALVIDYMQQVAQSNDDNVRMVIGRVANAFRKLAQEFNVPVIAISSTARPFYSGQARKALATETDPLAWLGAAKESGDIEFAAAVLMFLDVHKRDKSKEEHPARIVVAKSRRGSIGFVGAKFHGPSGVFTPDDNAVVEMQRQAQAEDEQVIIDALKQRPMTRDELKDAVGKQKKWVLERVKILLLKKRIDEIDGPGKAKLLQAVEPLN